jgi:hypothetical protein
MPRFVRHITIPIYWPIVILEGKGAVLAPASPALSAALSFAHIRGG